MIVIIYPLLMILYVLEAIIYHPFQFFGMILWIGVLMIPFWLIATIINKILGRE